MLASRLHLPSVIRNLMTPLSSVRYEGTSTYDGDGKTKVSILNQEVESGLMINSFSQMGFRLNNGMMVIGPMAIFPRTVFAWNVKNYEEINMKSLSLFITLEPKLDVLVVGSGDEPMTPTFSKNIISFMKKYNINVEVLPTEQACTTFNFLVGEKRVVAAALIPPSLLSINESEFISNQLERKRMLELED
ncbi:CLUMA_CG010989, isoform A [Clunio marinus]|uniref:NADH dehydrogenase [ubiquinone] 1 alpha subcomplex assembly factor 3 n=1 Tax=Clunio marinus TaxID=568069 RepID=A0A1J1IBL5_9DIPT|nr:CLUMA_CG010989, isoform A [Clunio marinus]